MKVSNICGSSVKAITAITGEIRWNNCNNTFLVAVLYQPSSDEKDKFI